MSKNTLLLIFLLFTGWEHAQGQEVLRVADDFTSEKFDQAKVYFLEDPDGSLRINDITDTSEQSKFRVIDKVSPNFGSSESVFWLKIKIQKDPENTHNDYLLELAYPVLDSIQFYSRDMNDHWIAETTGDAFPYRERKIKHRNFIFPISLDDHQIRTFYLRLHSKGSLIAPLVLYKNTYLRESQVEQEIFYGIYYGALLIMALYNLFIFFTLKDKNYLLYTFTIILNVLVQSSLLGHPIQYLWGNQVVWANNSVLFFTHLLFMANLLFSISFLKVRKYQKELFYVMAVFAAANGLLAALVFVLDYNIALKILLPFTLLTILLIIFSGIWTWIKGSQYARLFVLAWVFYLLSLIFQLLKHSGFLPDSFWTSSSTLFGSLLEILLLSFALADRINIYRRDVEKAQRLALEKAQENEKLIAQQNETLEKTVAQKTKDLRASNAQLQSTNDELKDLNEELQETQAELQSQRDFVESQNKDLSRVNHQVSLSIDSAKTIQEAMLPYEGKFAEFFHHYFIINRPKDVVSGDFYWLSKVGNKIILVVADCTGHGVPGAFMTLIGGNLLDKIVNYKRIDEPNLILENLHQEVQYYLKQKYNGNNSGMDLVVIALEKQVYQSKLTFAGAKNNLLLWTQGGLKELSGTRKSVGGIQNENIFFENQELILQQGNWIYLGSDGLEDQNDVNRKKFGKKRIKAIIEEAHDLSAFSQKEKFEAALDWHMQGTVARDDILWLGVKV